MRSTFGGPGAAIHRLGSEHWWTTASATTRAGAHCKKTTWSTDGGRRSRSGRRTQRERRPPSVDHVVFLQCAPALVVADAVVHQCSDPSRWIAAPGPPKVERMFVHEGAEGEQD